MKFSAISFHKFVDGQMVSNYSPDIDIDQTFTILIHSKETFPNLSDFSSIYDGCSRMLSLQTRCMYKHLFNLKDVDKLDFPWDCRVPKHPNDQQPRHLSLLQIKFIELAYKNYILQYLRHLPIQSEQHSIESDARLDGSTGPKTGIIPNESVNVQRQPFRFTLQDDNIRNQELDDDDDDDDDGYNDNNIDENDNAVENRDWLDNFYMLSRIIILFSIVYFYSTPLRCLIVTLLGFTIYLYHNGFFRRYQILPVDTNNDQERLNRLAQNDIQMLEIYNRPENETEPLTALVNRNTYHEERRNVLAFTWSFLSSFFSSLIPDQANMG